MQIQGRPIIEKLKFLFSLFFTISIFLSACGVPTAPTLEAVENFDTIQEPVDPEAELYRMFFDTSGDSSQNQLIITEFVGNIQVADIEEIFGDLESLRRKENGNFVDFKFTEEGIYYLNASPDGVGLNLSSWMFDGTGSSAFDFNGDNLADLVDFRLPGNQRITLATETLGVAVFENWLKNQNPLCNTDLIQQLNLPQLDCGETGDGGSGGGGGIAGLDAGIVDPLGLVCAGFDTRGAGILNRANGFADGQRVLSHTYRSVVNDRNVTFVQSTFVFEDQNGDYAGTFRTIEIYDHNTGQNYGLITESVDADGTGTRQITDNVGVVYPYSPPRSSTESFSAPVDSGGKYDSTLTSPPLRFPIQVPANMDSQNVEVVRPEEVPVGSDTKPEDPGVIDDAKPVDPPSKDNPGPEGNDSSVFELCSRRGEHQSGAEIAAGNNPEAFAVSCNDLVGAPSSGDDCTIIEWSGSNDFTSILAVPSTDSCGEFQVPNENGECEPSNAIERLKGLTAVIASLDLPDVSLCNPTYCDERPDSFAQSQQINSTTNEQPSLATETPTDSGVDLSSSEYLVGTAIRNSACRSTALPDGTVVNFLFTGETAELRGRLSTNSWFYVELPENRGRCWIYVENLDITGAVSELLIYPDPQPTSVGDGGANQGEGNNQGNGEADPEGPEDCDPNSQYWSNATNKCEPLI